KGSALDVTLVRDGDDHLLFLNEVLDLDLSLVFDDLGATILAVRVAYVLEFANDDLHQQLFFGQDGAEARDQIAQLAVFFGEPLLLEARQLAQTHFQDGFDLSLAQAIIAAGARLIDLLLGATSSAHELFEALERERHLTLLGFVGVTAGSNGVDHDVRVRRDHAESFDQLALCLGLREIVARAAADDLAAVFHEQREPLFEVEHRGPSVDDG